jgi:hypothetical protein
VRGEEWKEERVRDTLVEECQATYQLGVEEEKTICFSTLFWST